MMEELLYEEKTLLTYEGRSAFEMIFRFFMENPTKRLIFYLFYYYSQKKISLSKYLYAILCLVLCLLLLNSIRGKEPSFIVENRVGAALTVSAFLFRVWIDQLDALDRRERQGRTHAR